MMAGVSKALEFPSEVVFQRVTNSQEASGGFSLSANQRTDHIHFAQASSLLRLSATAQQVELTARFLWQNQQQGLLQVSFSLRCILVGVCQA